MECEIPSRETLFMNEKAALLVIDVQEYCCRPGESSHTNKGGKPIDYFFGRLEETLFPNVSKLLEAARNARCEVIYTVIESLTLDGRDNSLDYKISKLHVPKGHPGARVCTEVAPIADEIVIPKTSCSVFNSTNIEYVLRNLGVEQLLFCGVMTNQCVESAVRDAADRGFLCITVEDACACKSEEEHLASLHNLKGFSRIAQTEELIYEMGAKEERGTKKQRLGANAALKPVDFEMMRGFSGETFRLAVLRPGDDAVYAANTIEMLQQLFDSVAMEFSFEVLLEDFLIKENTNGYPDDYTKFDGVVIPGSVDTAYDDLPWLHRLAEEIRTLHRFRKPTIGICFGHQMIALALGGEVTRNPAGCQYAEQKFIPTREARELFQKDEEAQLCFFHHNNDVVTKLPTIENVHSCRQNDPDSSDGLFPMLYIGDYVLSFQGHPEFSTTLGKAILAQLLENDFTKGKLPKFEDTTSLQQFLRETVWENGQKDFEQFARIGLHMIGCKRLQNKN